MRTQIVRHHLLELILWPNKDGTFKEIKHTANDLRKLGIYDDFKLTIEMTRGEHCSLHKPHKDCQHSEDTRKRISKNGKGRHANSGKCFKGMKWKVINGKRVWYNG